MAATVPFETIDEFINALAKIELIHRLIAKHDADDRETLAPGDDFYLTPTSIQRVSPRHNIYELLFTSYKVRQPHRDAVDQLGYLGADIKLGFDAVRGTQSASLCEDNKSDRDINDAFYDKCVKRASEVLGVEYPSEWLSKYCEFVANHWPKLPYR